MITVKTILIIGAILALYFIPVAIKAHKTGVAARKQLKDLYNERKSGYYGKS